MTWEDSEIFMSPQHEVEDALMVEKQREERDRYEEARIEEMEKASEEF